MSIQADSTKKECPKCRLPIPRLAVVCPVCRSEIKEKPSRQKKWDRTVSVAKFVKDWIGFPAAAIAAIAALYAPARENILSLLGRDGANLRFEALRPDAISLGQDDTPVSAQKDKIDINISFLRAAFVNDGASTASVMPEFMCSVPDDNQRAFTSRYQLIDINSQKRLLEDVEVPTTGPVFVNVVLKESGLAEDGYGSTATLGTCEFRFSDKYGSKLLTLHLDKSGILQTDHSSGAVTTSDIATSILELDGAEDNRVAPRNRFCAGMLRGIRMDSEPIDCITGTHVIAIEPVYLWERGLQRALRQVAEFRRLAPDAAARSPGLILTDCTEENCVISKTEMELALASFSPSVTVWMCDEWVKSLGNCVRTDFTVNSK
ncbi:hypothetical protein X737_22120 [Mesorhizobium sp. L48C026A00]|nr:hypothetical protein X737_22120 [Mesorhizobium sp. L48C026A00]